VVRSSWKNGDWCAGVRANKFLSEIENLLMLESAAEQKETKFEEVVQMCCKALMCST
jgi:hypothetical protein